MSGILKRVVLMEMDTSDLGGGKQSPVIRPTGYALVTTSQGTGVEYFNWPQVRPDGQGYDPADEVAMVNEIRFVNMDELGRLLSSDESPNLHGGYTNPRTGR
jgi:hypothetical protein